MSMHLHHPSLSLGGKKKGKQKFRSAEEAQRARKLAEDWEALKQRHGVPTKEKRVAKIFEPLHTAYKLSAPPGRETARIGRSLPDNHLGAVSSKPRQQYTGDKMIGIGTLHKSNAVPIFSDEEAKEQARMRRG